MLNKLRIEMGIQLLPHALLRFLKTRIIAVSFHKVENYWIKKKFSEQVQRHRNKTLITKLSMSAIMTDLGAFRSLRA